MSNNTRLDVERRLQLLQLIQHAELAVLRQLLSQTAKHQAEKQLNQITTQLFNTFVPNIHQHEKSHQQPYQQHIQHFVEQAAQDLQELSLFLMTEQVMNKSNTTDYGLLVVCS